MVQEKLNKVKEEFVRCYGFTPKWEGHYELKNNDIVDLFNRGGSIIKMGVINLLNIKDGVYKYHSMHDQLNSSFDGNIVIKNGVITIYSILHPHGEVTDSFILDFFDIDNKKVLLPVLAWGEYPILVEL